ncbi:hypothetical protein NESM_000291100 [Novymonas esmeraldas]|uniref:Exportin-1/Importin-beta-like domain-containing protein n=1 Tax=Novymonas esmeraldas TaxID=1808958 RepID=A0AAW0F7V5_9TRYP
MGNLDVVDVAAAAAAVVRFAAHGDPGVNQQLMHAIDHSLDAGGTPAAHTLAPRLLRWALEDTAGAIATPASRAAVAYVSALNRHFCVHVVLQHLSQPLDRRPAGLAELLSLYHASVYRLADSNGAAYRQLVQCVACLLVVTEDHLVECLHAWIRGGDGASAAESRAGLHVFSAVVDLLADRRVALGSIRRATQRRHVQEHLHLVLQTPLTAEADMPLLVRVTDAAVRFLLEAMFGEPQEVAATLWELLPTSAVWQHCLRCLGAATTTAAACPTDVLDLICDVLRCQTLLTAAAEALLSSALPLVLQPTAPPSTSTPATAAVGWEAISRVLAAALEASTAAIVAQQPSDGRLFHLLSSAADRMAQLLQSPAAPAAAVCFVCEGISALTQALEPAPLPEMETDDDPEDFASFVEATEASNAEKRCVVARLTSFLRGCATALAVRLTRSGFAAAEWRHIASHVTRRNADGGAEDFAVVHDDLETAVFATYERLTALTGPLSLEEVQLAAPELSQQLVLVLGDPDLCLRWVESVPAAALLPQSALLPSCVARYVSATSAWATESAAARVMAALLRALATYAEEDTCRVEGTTDDNAAAVLQVATAAAAVVLAVARRSGEVAAAHLRERSAPLVSTLWRSALSATTSVRHAAADELAVLLESGVVILPEAAVGVLAQQDAYTQALLCATGGTSTASLDTVEALAHTLQCVGRLAAAEAEALQARVCRSIVVRARRHIEADEWDGEAFAGHVDGWHAQHPALLGYVTSLAAAAPPAARPGLLMSALARFFSLPGGGDTATAEVVEALAIHVVDTVAASAATAPSLHALLLWLLQPHPSFTAADGARRVRALAQCGQVLCERGHVEAHALSEALVAGVARWHDFTSASALSAGAAEDVVGADDDVEGDAEELQLRQQVLERLAVWGRCVAAAPAPPETSPAWLLRLHSAQDDYERVEILKGV